MKRFLAILLSALMVLSTISVMASEVGSATMAVEYANNGVFRISGTLPATSGDYKIIAAQYDANGAMIDSKTAAAVDDFGMFSTTMEFSYAPAKTKFMLWEMNSATPCAEVVALPDEGGYNLITPKTEVGTSTGGEAAANPLMNLVDGDDSTCAVIYGNAGSQGAMFVDLEAAYEIDRVEVLAYHNFFNRGSGFDVVLGNTVPDNIAYEEDADEFKAGTVAEDLTAVSAGVGYKTFYVPANAGKYRYVSLETFDETDGLSVAELKVYVKNAPEEIEYTSVTDKATSHKSSSTATATTYETDANNYLVDGNASTEYGTGPANGAYYTFVDLGYGGRPVNKVVITTNDVYGPDRVKGQKYYLANTLPINGADRSEWVYLGTRINNAVPMTFILDEDQAGTYRYVVADCTDSAVGGYVNEIEVYKDSSIKEIEYVSVTENATTHLASSTDTAATYDTDASNSLVDGDKTTMYGVGPAADAYYTFIDLGEGGRRVDMVAITTNDIISADRVKGQKYYLANTLPLAGADRSGWVFLGERVQNGVTMTFVLDETQAGVYRYVVADCTASTVGGYVNEIEVYKDATIEEAVIPTNVARGKTVTASATSTVSGYTNPAVITDGVYNSGNANNQFILTSVPSTVCIDLEARYSISEMTIDAVSKNDNFDFTANLEVYISDTPTATATVPSSATKVLDASATGWDQTVKTLEFDEPIDGRYVIIKKTAKRDNNDSFRLSEVEVMGVPSTETDVEVEATNVALGKANANSVVYSMGASAGYADVSVITDGSVCVGGNGQQFIGGYHGVFCLDLGASYDIEKVMIDAVATQFSSNLSVYLANEPYSEGLPAEKTTILDGTANPAEWGVATKTIELDTPVNARYIIVHRTAGGVFRLGELEVWGK